ncbi:hypothetical protein AJ80_04732 [Polytolypa hystricis UAMH7299]|uniref:Tetraspanin Tsp3 n=1 Tax=Polytolypa hystricis (strain UAMH7299) TaxID=1447883 RepID=A0A2B7Y0X9_POLH7|nr:hypothetical protein AJ80_04732 [Polytolypa hystricis UAMH7299]
MAISWILHGLCALTSIIFIALSIYAASRSSYLSLPIPTSASALAIVISLITYPLLSFFTTPPNPSQPYWLRVLRARLTPYILVILNTILLTLSTTHLTTPTPLQSCALRETWLSLYRAKDERAIRRIQDGLECCGFRSSRDMAWPFPDNAHGSNACEVAFGRRVGCEDAWGAEGRRVLVGLVVVGSLGVVCVILSHPSFWQLRALVFQRSATGAARQGNANQGLLTGRIEEEDEEDEEDEPQPYADDPEQGQQPQRENNASQNAWN